MEYENTADGAARAARASLRAGFRRRGIRAAVLSGMGYGVYTACMTLAMSLGVWARWTGENSGLSAFAALYLLGALGAASTDTCSAFWALLAAAARGKLGDYARCLRSRPGRMLMLAAVLGGPAASTCYVLGLQSAGSLVVPVSAMCPAIGAVLGRVLFRQALSPRMLLGIGICAAAGVMIGSTGLAEGAPPHLFRGLAFGLLAALGWGLEGCVGGYASALVDPEIGIAIRQTTSSLTNLVLLVPLFSVLGGVDPVAMVTAAFTDAAAMPWFMAAGLGAYFGFMLWYKGNAMCGPALGMACNGAYAFWGPFFCWLLLGLAMGREGYMLPPVAWLAAVTMLAGIVVISVNPLRLLARRER